MGGIVQVSDKEHSPWTGGLPQSDWNRGLDITALQVPVTPNQYRPLLISTAQKGHTHRQTGLSVKFTSTSDLLTFEHKVWEHLVDNGMDTIAYVPDPQAPSVMINCVKGRGRFDLDTVTAMIRKQLPFYDAFDKMNDREATHFLLDSLDSALAREMRDVMDDSEPFPVAYIRVIQAIRSASTDRYEHLKARIRSRHPSQYPGQDVRQMASDFRADAVELEIAGFYDHSLTHTIIKAFLAAGGEKNESYRFPLHDIKIRFNKELKTVVYMDKDTAQKYLAAKQLTYKDICNVAVDNYRTQFDSVPTEWPPARGNHDSKAPPRAFGNVASAPFCSPDAKAIAQAFALIQQGAASSGASVE
jgi:hypothetical protein